MEQHPIPRQITTFEFKLIGFMTLHQFIYLVVFIPLGLLVYKVVFVPFLNILLGMIIAGAGLLLAFLPVNDRPLDVFLKNLYKRLTSPTQYVYRKSNKPLYFLDDLFLSSGPHNISAHVDSKEKLSQYLQSQHATPVMMQDELQRAAGVKTALEEPKSEDHASTLPKTIIKEVEKVTADAGKPQESQTAQPPFFVGEVKNNKETPLPEILVYIKDQNNNPLRLLKTNPHGVFATFNPLPKGEYTMEAKDPRGSYLFDTMKIQLGETNPAPFTVISKGFL